MPLEKCPDKEAYIEFTVKSTLVKEQIGSGETLSMMSDVVSVDSGPESEYDFNDLEDGKDGEGRGASGLRKKLSGNLSGRKPAPNVLKANIKKIQDPTKPPLQLGKMGTITDLDADQIILGSGNKEELKRTRTDLDDIKKVRIDFKKATLAIQEEQNESSYMDMDVAKETEIVKIKKPLKVVNKGAIKL